MQVSLTFVYGLFSHNLKINVKNSNNQVFGFFIFILYKQIFSFTRFKLTFLCSEYTAFFLFKILRRKNLFRLRIKKHQFSIKKSQVKISNLLKKSESFMFVAISTF